MDGKPHSDGDPTVLNRQLAAQAILAWAADRVLRYYFLGSYRITPIPLIHS
jgi:hypothetical protein